MIAGPATLPAEPSRAVGPLEIEVVTALCLAAAVIFALHAGEDANWDQRNPHIAGAYPLLTGREGVDVAPLQMQTWFNPLPYVPAFLAIETFPSKIATVLLAMAAGLNGLLVYLLGRRLLVAYPTAWAMVSAAP
ncbi:MAG: hypothetical protein U1E45_13045 [Geminicoccaceae bacterium]